MSDKTLFAIGQALGFVSAVQPKTTFHLEQAADGLFVAIEQNGTERREGPFTEDALLAWAGEQKTQAAAELTGLVDAMDQVCAMFSADEARHYEETYEVEDAVREDDLNEAHIYSKLRRLDNFVSQYQ